MPVVVHSEVLQRQYIASWCSVACFINFLIIVGAAILPLYIAWASHSFWIKEDVRFEQPIVTYKSELALAIQGYKGTVSNQRPFQLLWSTSPSANDFYGNSFRGSVLKSSVRDNNLDGVADELHFKITTPLLADEIITGVSTVAFVDAEWKHITRAQMDGLLITSHNSATPGSAVFFDGQMRLQQRDSLPFVPAGIYKPYLLSPLAKLVDAKSTRDADIFTIASNYATRNHTLLLDCPNPLWRHEVNYEPVTPGSSADTSSISLIPREFTTTIVARIPPSGVVIRPGVAEELKHGWIQYLSFLVITAAAGWIVRKVFFAYHIIETSVYADGPRSKLHIE